MTPKHKTNPMEDCMFCYEFFQAVCLKERTFIIQNKQETIATKYKYQLKH